MHCQQSKQVENLRQGKTALKNWTTPHVVGLATVEFWPGSAWELDCSKFGFCRVSLNLKQVNEKSCRLRMGSYRDGVKKKGDKIGMGL